MIKITTVNPVPVAKVKNPRRQAGGVRSADSQWRRDGKLPSERVVEILRTTVPTDRYILLDRQQIAEDAAVKIVTVHKMVQRGVREGWLDPKVKGRDNMGRRLVSTRVRRIALALAEEVA